MFRLKHWTQFLSSELCRGLSQKKTYWQTICSEVGGFGRSKTFVSYLALNSTCAIHIHFLPRFVTIAISKRPTVQGNIRLFSPAYISTESGIPFWGTDVNGRVPRFLSGGILEWSLTTCEEHALRFTYRTVSAHWLFLWLLEHPLTLRPETVFSPSQELWKFIKKCILEFRHLVCIVFDFWFDKIHAFWFCYL